MRKGIAQLVAIGIVIGIGSTLVAVLFQWLPTSASEEFDRIQDIYWFATVMHPRDLELHDALGAPVDQAR